MKTLLAIDRRIVLLAVIAVALVLVALAMNLSGGAPADNQGASMVEYALLVY
jgi:Flp pilus assembly pilin Flp